MDVKTQTLEDFQPLSKAANDAKRQFCKECRRTRKRFDAKLLEYPMLCHFIKELKIMMVVKKDVLVVFGMIL